MGSKEEMSKGARAYGKAIGKLAKEVAAASLPLRQGAADRMVELGMRQGIRLGAAGAHLGIIISGGAEYGIAPGRWVDVLVALFNSGDWYEALKPLQHDGTPCDLANDREIYLETVGRISLACLDELERCVDPERDRGVAMRGYLEILTSAIAQALLASGITPEATP